MNKKSVIVIGAGIVGVATAIWLQRDGHQVTLLDKSGPAAGTSFGNAGNVVPSSVVPVNSAGLLARIPQMLTSSSSPLFLRWQHLPKMLPWLLRYLSRANRTDTMRTALALRPLIEDSVALHKKLSQQTAAHKWLVPSDYVFVYNRRADFNKDAFLWSIRKQVGIQWDELSGEQFQAYDPQFGQAGKHAIRLANHARVTHPAQYVKDLAAHFQKEGGSYKQAQAQGIVGNDRGVSGVRTEAGVIPCDCAVIACGVWSKTLVETLGLKIPLESERGYFIDFMNPSERPRAGMMIADGKFVVSAMENRIRCAGLVEFAGLDAPMNQAALDFMRNYFTQAWPNIKYDTTEQWLGHRPAPVDSIPFIGGIDHIPNLYSAFGHHHIGLTSAAKTGQMIADLVANRDIGFDMNPYRVSRFTH